MRILYIGDIVGSKGLEFLEKNLNKIKNDNKINLVIANAENVTHGRGLNKEHYLRLMKLGIFALTMGNHTFSQRQIKEYINDSKIVRPANLTTEFGKGYMTLNYNDRKITIVNLLGRIYMNNMSLDCPFKTMDKIYNIVKDKSDYIIVDFHAEATSEKIAFGYDFDGKVSAVVGTHTHVPTADERILPNGTLYVTDIGMTGPYEGILGDNKETIIERFRSGVYEPCKTLDSGKTQFNAVILDFNSYKNSISRIKIIE
ncbi:MAG: TIGR00282 family metallophosphoesterase [Anaeroplasmataceae bacterium]